MSWQHQIVEVACNARNCNVRFATGGTPVPIVTQLNEIANHMLQEPKTVELLMKQGIIPRPMTPDEYKRFVASESEKFSKVILEAKINPEG